MYIIGTKPVVLQKNISMLSILKNFVFYIYNNVQKIDILL